MTEHQPSTPALPAEEAAALLGQSAALVQLWAGMGITWHRVPAGVQAWSSGAWVGFQQLDDQDRRVGPYKVIPPESGAPIPEIPGAVGPTVTAPGQQPSFSLGERRDDGRLQCDFCGQLDPTCYYECANFQMQDQVSGGTFDSGDRFYACPDCRSLVDADDWKGLRRHVGPLSDRIGMRVLWAGFRRHRLSETPVEFPAGINPEEIL